MKQIDGVNVYDIKTFPYKEFEKIKVLHKPRGNQGRKEKPYLLDITTAFDIETTRLEDIEQSIMFVWQFGFDNIGVVIGRTWDEFKRFLKRLKRIIDGKKGKYKDIHMVIYVHNLSYEFQFLSGIYPFKEKEVFAIGSRKVLHAEMFNTFEFRCSYLQSNMGLEKFTEKMNVKHKKLDGDDFDYSKKRYPWTALTDDELDYCINDVVGLIECINTEMTNDFDTLYTIPMTSTGYVRRDIKLSMRQVPHTYISELAPDEETYTMLRQAFRGGDTHANRYYAGKILTGVKSADRKSSYPAEEMLSKYPVTPFVDLNNPTFERVKHYIFDLGKAVLFECYIKFELADKYEPMPYIPKSHVRNLTDEDEDNGRLMCGAGIITLTDIDFRIIIQQYDITEFQCFKCKYSTYGRLPQPLLKCVMSYFQMKTDLDGVAGQEYYYMKAKNKMNSIYGCSAQDPCKIESKYIDGTFQDVQPDITKTLRKYYKSAVQLYQHGVWLTAAARFELHLAKRICGYNLVYCDTDSVFYIDDGTIDFASYNEPLKKKAIALKAYATDPKGQKRYLGVYEPDKTCQRFITLGAKKYAYEDGKGKLHITVSGVVKDKGAEELGCLENFKTGFIFQKAGGVELVYNEPSTSEMIGQTIQIDGHDLKITNNVVIRPSSYTLGVSEDYGKLLDLLRYEYSAEEIDVEIYKKFVM